MAVPAQAAIEITATSQEMPNWQDLPAAQPPTITMNGEPFATLPDPSVPNGWQVVVINATADLTDPANILYNDFLLLQADSGEWGSTYTWMYDQMLKEVLDAGNPNEQLLLLASFGLDGNMPPPNDALEFLLERGAGQELQKWETTSDSGSESNEFIGYPAAYALVGGSGFQYGEGTEGLDMENSGTASTTVNITLDNNVPPGGAGDSPPPEAAQAD
jgi:hypothetical protein